MTNQKGLAPILIILIVIGVLAVGGGVWWWQKSKQFQPSCAKEGENFSSVYKDKYPEHCCQGLTEWQSGMDTSRVENGICVQHPELESGYPVGTCIKCGDGVCGKNENVCNCPQDCAKSMKITDCTFNEDEKKEYLSKIKEYLKTNSLNLFGYNIDATKYNKIVDISESRYQGKEVCETILDCCFTGDRAYIDKESGEIIGFQLGPE